MVGKSGSSTATISRWSRAFVAVGVGFFVLWQVAVAMGLPRAATVPLGVFGFVFHVVFGKGYTLLPSYFARELAVPHAPAIHLPFAVVGALGSSLAGWGVGPSILAPISAASWLVGCLVFVGTLAWTIRTNPTGRETGTGATETHRKRIDRLANAAVPVVLAYLLVATALPLFSGVGLEPAILPASGPAATHMLAAGAAGLLVFAVGFRLLPRLLVASTSPILVGTVLVAGAIGPALLALDFQGGAVFHAGAAFQTIALCGFAIGVVDLFRRSERRRVGGWALLGAAASSVLVAVLGLTFAFVPASSIPATAFDTHYRLAVGGFLGLTIVGVSYHFYPPAIASSRGIDDRTAMASVVALVAGLGLEIAGLLTTMASLTAVGRWLGVGGALLYAAVLWTIFLERTR